MSAVSLGQEGISPERAFSSLRRFDRMLARIFGTAFAPSLTLLGDLAQAG